MSEHQDRPTLQLTAHDHAQGSPEAAVTLVEYGDFECPYTREAITTVQALHEQFGGDLRFVYRHFPLTHKHPHALQASEAAEAAGAQDQFWPMYALLFANQWELEYSELIEYARRLGLDLKRFGKALNEHQHLDRIRSDIATGRQHGVRGTPTFFVNGKQQDGADDVPALSAAIRQTLGDR